MRPVRAVVCILLVLTALWAPVFAQDADPENAEVVRTGLTLAGAASGLAAGTLVGIGFSMDAIDTPLSNALLLTIPVAAVGAATGALAGHWMAEVFVKHHPSPLLAVVEGAGLGLLCGAFVGAITFATNFVIAYPILDVPEGYWGRFDYLQTIGMAVLAGAFWGGFFGMVGGALILPLVSLSMGF
jgi:hypothetical protein